MSHTTKRYSSDVKMRLLVEGRSFEVSQVSDSHVVFRVPVDLPECDAELVIQIDDHEIRDVIHLLDGSKSKFEVSKILVNDSGWSKMKAMPL